MGPPIRDISRRTGGWTAGHDHRLAALPNRGANAALLELVVAVPQPEVAKRLEETHGEIAQEQSFVAAGSMHLLKRVVQDLDELTIALLHRDANPLTEIFGIQIGSAAKFAAPIAGHTVQPEGESDAVAEHEVDLSVLQSHLRIVGAVERHGFGGRKELLQIGLVPGPARYTDLLSLHRLGTNVFQIIVLSGDEAR